MNTQDFRTPQAFADREQPKAPTNYLIGLDAGYSSMKVFAENKYFYFPTFAKKVGEDMLNIVQPDSIEYEDLENNERYILGRVAQNMVKEEDTGDTVGEWLSRKRYANRKFQILCNAAIAIATIGREDDGRELFIQTGLPTDYMGDKKLLVKCLCKPAKFRIRIGTGKWFSFENGLDLKPENIEVMPQPAGSLYSIMINRNGEMIADYMGTKTTLIMDVGFGTFDFFGVKKGSLTCKASIPNVGMEEVLMRTSKYIREEYEEDIHISAMQSVLEKGTVQCIEDDEDEIRSDEKPISDILEKANYEVFQEAFEAAKSTTSSFRGYDNIVIAGGTGAAWFDYFKEKFKNMHGINLFSCNQNDDIPIILGNVRGYYMFRYRQCLRK